MRGHTSSVADKIATAVVALLAIAVVLTSMALTSVVNAAAASLASASDVVPAVTVEPSQADPGSMATLSIEGFESPTVTVAICGNEARRGSSDCDMVASTGVVLAADGTPTLALIPVVAPPMPCPCVVRVTSPGFDEIAVAPLEVIGHETAELVSSAQAGASLVVAISATRVAGGLAERIDAGLGGDVDYEAVVTLTNTGSAPVDGIILNASFGRSAVDFLGEIVVEAPASLGAGQTWQQVVPVTVPPRVVGTVAWKVTAAAGLFAAEASTTTTQRPTLLVGLVSLVVLDLGIVAIRWRIRRHARAAEKMTAAGAS